MLPALFDRRIEKIRGTGLAPAVAVLQLLEPHCAPSRVLQGEDISWRFDRQKVHPSL